MLGKNVSQTLPKSSEKTFEVPFMRKHFFFGYLIDTKVSTEQRQQKLLY